MNLPGGSTDSRLCVVSAVLRNSAVTDTQLYSKSRTHLLRVNGKCHIPGTVVNHHVDTSWSLDHCCTFANNATVVRSGFRAVGVVRCTRSPLVYCISNDV
jgi:hypothetical protein